VHDPIVRCAKKQFSNFLLFAIELAVLSVFWQKKGLGPSRVNMPYNIT